MDGHVDEMSKAYKSLVDSISAYLWAIRISSGQKSPFTNTALKNFKDQYEAFKAACDKAEDFVDTKRKRLAAEYLESAADLVDTTTKKAAGESSGNAGNVAEFMKQLLEEWPDSAAEKPEGSKNSEDAKPDSPTKSSEDVKAD